MNGKGKRGGGKDYTAHQKNVIRNYYEHKPARLRQKLGEAVSDLYLEGSSPKAEHLWKQVEKMLLETKVAPSRVRRITAAKDLNALAEVVGEIF